MHGKPDDLGPPSLAGIDRKSPRHRPGSYHITGPQAGTADAIETTHDMSES